MKATVVLAATLALAPAAAAARPGGFHADGVRCAVGLRLGGLVCASPAIRRWQYDGRGVVRVLPDGRVRVHRSGSDVLLAVDDAASRPLRVAATWRRDGYACASLAGGVVCARRGHGFFLSARVFRRF